VFISVELKHKGSKDRVVFLVTKLLMTQQDDYSIAEPSLLVVVFKADIFILSMAISLLPILFSFNAKIFTVDI